MSAISLPRCDRTAMARRKRLMLVVLRAVVCVGLALWVLPVVAAGEQTSSPVDGALDSSVWYDAESSRVLPVYVEPVVDDSLNRDSRWLPKAKKVKDTTSTASTSTGGGGGSGGSGGGVFGSGLTIGNLFGWLLLIVLFVAAIGGLVYVMSKAEIDLAANSRSRRGGERSQAPDEQMIERMKHLPAELRRTDVNLRTEAQRLMNEGFFDQAIILLFGHQLLLLDHAGMLRLNRGKTNRKYVLETRTIDPESAQRLAGTVTAFERSYFGRHQITREEFEGLWRVNLELEQAVARRGEVAA